MLALEMSSEPPATPAVPKPLTPHERILAARHHHPHEFLGLHVEGDKLIARAFLRNAETCEVVDYSTAQEHRYPLERLDKRGFFEGEITGRASNEFFPYRLRTTTAAGEVHQFYDPYSFPPSLGDQDLYLFNEGNEHRVYEKLGAHPRTLEGVPGVSFAVWAPNAKRISVVGDFNHWDGRYHPMRSLGSSGVWELFIPGLTEGNKYKYEIIGGNDLLFLKTDPYATYYEPPPHNASIVYNLEGYAWGDQQWMQARAETDWKARPVSIYEVHLGSWRRILEDGNRSLTYRELAHELADYVARQGFTHVELMPVAEHPFSGSWGYQVTGFFAPTHRFGDPKDFMYFVDILHRRGIGVILDWVPGHFPVDSFALAQFDGTALYEHADPRQGFHQDWGTYIFNYGRNEVRGFLVANALSWLERYHIDGLRVDAVASMLYLDYSRKEGEWVPNQYGGRENIEAIEFLRTTNRLVHQYYPGVLTIAEESTAFGGITKSADEGGLGFDFKWNMGWMHDSLEYFQKDPLFRKWHQNNLTFGMIYQYSEDFVLVYSHDEVVHGKASMLMKMGAPSITSKAGTLRALYTLMWTWPGKKTLFMGSEFGQSTEWHYDQSLEWHLLQYLDHSGVQMIVRDLNDLYRSEKALHACELKPEGFEWISINDHERSVVAFLRKDPDSGQVLLVAGHYTPVARRNYRLGVPYGGYWREVLNSDSEFYGGTGEGNLGGTYAEPVACDGHRQSLCVTLPPNATVVFKWDQDG